MVRPFFMSPKLTEPSANISLMGVCLPAGPVEARGFIRGRPRRSQGLYTGQAGMNAEHKRGINVPEGRGAWLLNFIVFNIVLS